MDYRDQADIPETASARLEELIKEWDQRYAIAKEHAHDARNVAQDKDREADITGRVWKALKETKATVDSPRAMPTEMTA